MSRWPLEPDPDVAIELRRARRRCWCGRRVPDTSPCDCCCTAHTDRPLPGVLVLDPAAPWPPRLVTAAELDAMRAVDAMTRPQDWCPYCGAELLLVDHPAGARYRHRRGLECGR